MRIAIIGSRHILSGYSGVEVGLSQFLPYLIQRGHTATVFAGSLAGLSANDARLLRFEGIDMVTVPCLQGKHLETITRSGLSVARAIRGQYDVVHFQHQGPGVMSALTHLFKLPSIVTVCGLDWQRNKWGPFAQFAIRRAEQTAVRYSGGIAVLSRGIQQYFSDTYHRKTVYIPNGIPAKSAPKSHEALERFGVTPGQYVLFAARLVPEKGCHDLITAWNSIETPRKLVIAGSGSYNERYVEQLREMADPEKVVFTGHLDSAVLDQLYANAYLFVLPSYLEGMSNALLEALALGRPSLVSNIRENLEVIGDDGFAFKCGDVDDLRDKLSSLVADEARLYSMRLQVKASLSSRPTWSEVAARYEALYASVVGSHRSGAAASPNRPIGR